MGSTSLAKNTRFLIASGFTLIELLVVVAIIGILIVGVMGFMNPYEQIAKANDSAREQDLNHIRAALDAYYNDTGCYPTSLTFGVSLANPNNFSTIYMKKVPQDPTCATNASNCYRYMTDSSSSCPQWNVLFAALQAKTAAAKSSTQPLCPLEIVSSNSSSQGGGGCLPSFYSSNGYNFCLTSGQVNCGIIVSTSNPSSYLTPIPGCQQIYSCTSQTPQLPNGVCNVVGTNNNGVGLGQYCGAPGCMGNACCLNHCSQ